MPESRTSIPVLISGGGLTGLYLALSLARNGVSVRIIEKNDHFHQSSRGAGIHPRTLEIQRFLGVEQAILNWGGRTESLSFKIYKMPGGNDIAQITQFGELVDPTPTQPYGNAIMVPQSDHERVLRDQLADLGVTLELGKELFALEQDAEGVTAQVRVHDKDGQADTTETIRAEFLCGADGAKGPTRKLIGRTFVGQTIDGDALIIADMVIHGLDSEHWHMWRNGPGVPSFIARPHMDGKDKFCACIMGFDNSLDSVKIMQPGEFIKLFRDVVGRQDLQMEEPYSLSYWRPNIRMVDKFQAGRVFVLGDAAHVHAPAGGQGLNSSAQDGFNLGWKIALVHKGLASPTLLETYTEERLPIIRQMLETTTGLYNTMRKAIQQDGAISRGTELNQLGINFRWSSIVKDTRLPHDDTEDALDELKAYAYTPKDDSVAAGDRAPDAPGLVDAATGTATRLFDVFDVSKHTVLLFTAASGSSEYSSLVKSVLEVVPSSVTQTVLISKGPPGLVESGGRTLVDSEGHAFEGYKVADGDALTIVVVRPDSYIGAIVRTTSELQDYLSKIFIV